MGLKQYLGKITTFESLKIRNYRWLWMGQVSGSIGMWMDQVARSWLIYSMTHSAMSLGLVAAISGVPNIIFGIIAGPIADRYDRKMQTIVSQSILAAMNVIVAILIATGRIEVWHIYAISFLTGSVQAFQVPARQIMVNDVVGDNRLLNAISLNSAAMSVARSIGPALCGVFIQYFDVAAAYYAKAALYFLATVTTVQVDLPARSEQLKRAVSSVNFFTSMKEGFAYTLSNRLILFTMIVAVGPTLFGMPYSTLFPIFAVDIFHGNANTQGLLLTAMGVGAFIGALTTASLGRKTGSGKVAIGGAVAFGLCLLFFSQSPIVPIAMLFTFLAGLTNTGCMAQNQSMVQALASPQIRGRVVAIYNLNTAFITTGGLIAGALATYLGAPWTVALMGIALIALVVTTAGLAPDLWRLKLGQPDTTRKTPGRAAAGGN